MYLGFQAHAWLLRVFVVGALAFVACAPETFDSGGKKRRSSDAGEGGGSGGVTVEPGAGGAGGQVGLGGALGGRGGAGGVPSTAGKGGTAASGTGGVPAGGGGGAPLKSDAGGGPAGSGGATAAAAAVTFSDVYLTIVLGNCQQCHNPAKKGVDMKDKAATYASFKKLVTPGNADGSMLIGFIAGPGRKMPPKDKTPLDDGQVAKIKAWITAGANDD